ncbi:hypothetical protein A3F06_02650 [candidate division TM6 bacterium RIFCSPHIGHO2_12_FULL_36_22]|nr:MAG: hypothetical protein A3F06_02650 [candidate division TM6 bacterium RIFCSPHIGHO2_12_FULL_36_22]
MQIRKNLFFILHNFLQTLRFFLGASGCCRFTITCMQYAKIELKERPIYIALYNIFKRLLACNPFTRN